MNVAEYLLACKTADATALLPPAAPCTYGELAYRVQATATHLASSRLVKGDRVLLAADNSVFWVASYLGILRAGLVAVPLPTTISDDDLCYVIEITEPRYAFFDQKFLAKRRATDGLPFTSDLPTDRGVLGEAIGGDDDLAALMFTSGSTGKPRGVMVSHRNIIANTESIIVSLGLTGADRIMAVLPFHYCFGTSLLHTHLRVGGALVLDNRFLFPEVILQRMRETDCTGFAGVPSHYQILLRKSGIRAMSFPHLRYVQQAGGHLAPSFVSELRDALPTTRVFLMYGQTEATARLAYMPPEMLDRKPGSIGKAIPGVTLEVLDETGRPVAPGVVGEIVATGENITCGYWRDERESAKSFRNGRLHTGDLATVDEDGFIYVVDRAKDFLKCGGKRVSCRELEDAILECNDVLEVAIVGVPDEVLGEAPQAFVVPRSPDHVGLDSRLRAFCRQRLAAAFNPKQTVMLQSLPKNSSGKVLKAELRTYTDSASR